jgi:hypothetical protein
LCWLLLHVQADPTCLVTRLVDSAHLTGDSAAQQTRKQGTKQQALQLKFAAELLHNAFRAEGSAAASCMGVGCSAVLLFLCSPE